MLEYDPNTTLQHFPALPMSRFGLNPYQENLYRVVFGPSRRYLVYGEWPDGSVCAHWKIKYPFSDASGRPRPVWILEKWQSAADFTGGAPKESWNVILGPYPDRGEYELVHAFLEALPTSSQVEKLITWATYGRENVSFGETFGFQRDQEARKAQLVKETRDDIIRNRMPAFGARAFAGGEVRRRSHDEDADLKSAEELGLPTTPGMRTGKRAQQLISSAA